MKSAARPVSMSEAVEPGPPAHLVLVHDGAGVAVGEPVLVGQPVRALLAAQEGGAGFQACEPLREFSPGDGRDARDQVLMRFQGVVQSQLAPPGGDSCFLLRVHHARAPGNPRSRLRANAEVPYRKPGACPMVTWSGSAGKRRVASGTPSTARRGIRTAGG